LSREIWLGPVLSGNRSRLIARCADLLDQGRPESFLYIAASRPLLDLVTESLIDGVRLNGHWGRINLHLFRGFVRQILSGAMELESGLPLPSRTAVDNDRQPLKRSLISQTINRLAVGGAVKAIGPLAHRGGLVDAVSDVIGEIIRAGRTPAEFEAIVESRSRDIHSDQPALTPRQIDFDREISLIYSAYVSALDRNNLTDADFDQLRALEILRGDINGKQITVPWLAKIRLLIIDGFFDFTPIQGEILRLLVPAIPDVIVTLNRDDHNPEIFRPFSQTIDQLCSMADFEIDVHQELPGFSPSLSRLRTSLFNPGAPSEHAPAEAPGQPEDPPHDSHGVTLFECGNRETEIRAIAKEIKRLMLAEDYKLSDIAVVVRQRAAYSDLIIRVFESESIPCSLEKRIGLHAIPSVRAMIKLFAILSDLAREEHTSLKMSAVADLIKTGYFRLSDDEMSVLRRRFDDEFGASLLTSQVEPATVKSAFDRAGLGGWDPDFIENVVAYVGGQLTVADWLRRARRLVLRYIEQSIGSNTDINIESDDPAADSEEGSVLQSETATRADSQAPAPGSSKRARVSREIQPPALAWVALLIERLSRVLASVEQQGRPEDLSKSVVKLLEELQLPELAGNLELAQHELDRSSVRVALDLRGLEGARRALGAAARSINASHDLTRTAPDIYATRLTSFLEEALRCVRGQILSAGAADPAGLKVLEATEVRGLRFRAVFIAGLIENGFPLRLSRDWIYPHEERERLKQYGLTLEDISPDTLLKEEHYFYQAACRATERLYLSRPLLLEDGAETVASYYIDETSQALGPEGLPREEVRKNYDGADHAASSTAAELSVALVRLQERHRHRANRTGLPPLRYVDAKINEAIDRGWLSRDAIRRIAIERERAGTKFGSFDGVIANPSLVSMMASQFGSEHVFSASQLSVYGRCPFKFFAERVLRLEARGEAALDLTALDAGSLLHEVLRRFLRIHRGELLASLDQTRLRSELQKTADEVFDEFEDRVPPLNAHVWRIDREIRKILLDQILLYELTIHEKTQANRVTPAFFELGFGMSGEERDPASKEEFLEYQRRTESPTETGAIETISIRGQIDRVDTAEDGTAIAYDYKLSKGATLDDMIKGRQLQLEIYLAALERVFLPGQTIAGAGFYTLRGGQSRRNQGVYRAVLNQYVGINSSARSNFSDSEWKTIRTRMEQRIWEFIDGMRSGRFQVEPTDPNFQTCTFCDFSAVCRFDKFRNSRKK